MVNPLRDRPWAIIRLCTSLISICAAALAVLLGFSWYPNAFSMGFGVAAAALALLAAVAAFAECVGSRVASRATPWVFRIASLVGLAPAAVRAALPWEEPGTGYGSPMATLIGIVVLTGFFGVIVTIPMVLFSFFGVTPAGTVCDRPC